MKKMLLTVLTSTFISFSFGADYYWDPDVMSGSNNWNDLNNWFTTSGGTINHIALPGPSDDVYIDANTDYPVMLIDMNVQCRNFIIAPVLVSAPELLISGGTQVEIYGSMITHDDLSIFGGNFIFKATGSGHMVDLDLQNSMYENGFSLTFDNAGGSWDLAGPIYTLSSCSLLAGTLNTNGYDVRSSSFGLYDNLFKQLDLDTSEITVFDGNFTVSETNSIIDADSATIIFNYDYWYSFAWGFNGGINQHYYKVIIDTIAPVFVISGNNCEIDELIIYGSSGDNFHFTGDIHHATFYGGGSFGNDLMPSNINLVYDTLILDNGYSGSLTYYEYDTDTVFVSSVFEVYSGLADTISISGVGLFTDILALPDDTICLDYIKLQGSHTFGNGDYYSGSNSIDLGSNTGWIFNDCGFDVSIHESEKNNFTVYPNPAINEFFIQSEVGGSYEFYSASGQLVKSGMYTVGQAVSIESLENGLYILSVNSGEEKSLIKLIVAN